MGQTPCNSVQNLSTNQQIQLNNIKPLLDTALYHEAYSDIDSLHLLIKNIYGAQAGLPDALESSYTLTNTNTWLDLPNAINLSRNLIAQDSIYYTNLWRLAKGQSPLQAYAPHSIYLRYAAEVALGFLKIAHYESDLIRKNLYITWATTALDSLATMQLPNGAFPFPDLRTYNDPLFGPMIQSFLNACGADSVNVLINGWIVDDKGTGQFKFDAGVIADAYYQAYLYTNHVNYKNIAISIGNYLLNLKFNTNYNYNTFVSLGLTRAFQLTNDSAYLNRAIINIRYGLLPGQLSNGRWVDGHNAKSVYHAIILKNTSVTLNLVPNTSVYYDSLRNSMIKAINNYVNYYHSCNYSGTYFWAMRCYLLNASILHQTLKDSIGDIIGRHINQSALNGKFLDVATMGDYLELLEIINQRQENTVSVIKLNVFPNPASNSLYIDGVHSDQYNINVKNIFGQTVDALANPKEIDISKLANGLYFITIQQGTQTSTLKFIKQ